MPHHTNRQSGLRNRRGSVLVVVFVTILLLSLAAYGFTDLMVAEAKGTRAYHRDVQARALAESGIEWAATLLGDRTGQTAAANLFSNPELFQGILVQDAEAAYGRGRFSIVAPDRLDPSGQLLRFGLIDESAKLNLNTLMDSDLDEEQQRDALMKLPEMTAETADAILDWLDEDEQPRQSGAENGHYGTLNPPYTARNGRVASLDELLKVRGVTRWLLYGEDANRNGLLDANENDGEASVPFDDADGILWRGWSAYLTVRSKEWNRRWDGTPRIDVNQDDLAALYDALAAEFDEETARFVTAYRLYGPSEDESSGGGDGESRRRRQSDEGRSSRRGEGEQRNRQRGDGGGESGRGGEGSGGGRGGGGGSGGGGSGSGETRGGLDLSEGGQQEVESLYELVGSEVEAEVNGQEQTLQSPWSADSSALQSELPRMLDTLTTRSEPFIEGRINIYRAPREVLMTIPDVEETVVQAILGAQASGSGAVSGPSTATDIRATTGWLLADGLVEVERMRELDRYITARGDVFRLQAVGYYDSGGPVVRLEAIIDATQLAPRVVAVRDLSALGRGFTANQLNAAGSMAY